MVADKLTQRGFRIGQYTSLDGYSTDWPSISSLLGDTDITDRIFRYDVGKAVNYTVQDGLAVKGAEFFSWLFGTGTLFGAVTGMRLSTDALTAIESMTSWKAPYRPGFVNTLLPGIPPATALLRSHHTNVTELYSQSESRSATEPPEQYLFANYAGELRKDRVQPQAIAAASARLTAAAVGESTSVIPPPAPATATSAEPTSSTVGDVIDGSFERLGGIWAAFQTAQFPYMDEPAIARLVSMARDPKDQLAFLWQVEPATGANRPQLVAEGSNTLAELRAGHSIAQPITLDGRDRVVQFDLTVASAAAGDELVVTIDGPGGASFTVARQDLTRLPADGRVRLPLGRYPAGGGVLRFRVASPRGDSPVAVRLDNIAVARATAVAGRYVFYNRSGFDRNDAAPNAADDGAVAADKAALLPGSTGSFANVTSYSRGINGVMVDVANMPDRRNLTATDFAFRTASDGLSWTTAPAPSGINIRRGAGVDGSDRIALTWPDNSIRNSWLQVTLKPNANTGLTAPDVFYFGNLVGEVGDPASTLQVGAKDVYALRLNASSSTITGRYDFNRDGRVNVLDHTITRRAVNRNLPLLVPDTIAPRLVQSNPPAGEFRGRSFRDVTLTFSEPLDPGTVTGENFTLTGPVGTRIEPITIQTGAGGTQVHLTYPQLADGNWTVAMSGPSVTDRAGNALSAAAVTTTFWIGDLTTALNPSVAADADGDVVVVWQGNGQDGSAFGIYAQRYNATGAAQGGEFRVAYGGGDPAVAADADGDFVVVWRSFGSNPGVSARRYNAAGVAQGGEFRVDIYTEGDQDSPPSVAIDADGDFVVTWESLAEYDSYNGVYARRYNAAGVAQGGEFRVNTFEVDLKSDPAVAADADGDFVVTWQSYGPDGSAFGISARRYNAAGVAQGGEFRVNTFTAGNQLFPAVAADADGDFVVAWESIYQDGSDSGVYARRYNAAGVAQGGEFRVNTFTAGDQSSPAVAADADGDFVVAWQGQGQGFASGVYARRYNAAGVSQGGEFRVNNTDTRGWPNTAVAVDADGDFVVAWDWQSIRRDDFFYGISARRYNAAGVAQGGEFRVNTFTAGNELFPAVAPEAEGHFVVAGQSDYQDGTDSGVYARRYGANEAPARVTNVLLAGSAGTSSQATPIVRDKLVLGLDRAPGGLDGDWTNGADAFPSGDGTPGGDFRFRLNILAGDVSRDGRVSAADLLDVRRRLRRSAASPGAGATEYTPFHDLTANGFINASDEATLRRNLLRTLPPGEPTATATAVASAAVRPRGVPITRAIFGDQSIIN